MRLLVQLSGHDPYCLHPCSLSLLNQGGIHEMTSCNLIGK